jgi:hypothetical protein
MSREFLDHPLVIIALLVTPSDESKVINYIFEKLHVISMGIYASSNVPMCVKREGEPESRGDSSSDMRRMK